MDSKEITVTDTKVVAETINYKEKALDHIPKHQLLIYMTSGYISYQA